MPYNTYSKDKTIQALLDNNAAAAFLGVSSGSLEVWRSTKRYNLKYIKVGRLVKYRLSDLEEFLNRRTVESKHGL
jgi:hypothetical protein